MIEIKKTSCQTAAKFQKGLREALQGEKWGFILLLEFATFLYTLGSLYFYYAFYWKKSSTKVIGSFPIFVLGNFPI